MNLLQVCPQGPVSSSYTLALMLAMLSYCEPKQLVLGLVECGQHSGTFQTSGSLCLRPQYGSKWDASILAFADLLSH